MYCKNCGTENPDKALFCKECGAKLNEEDTVKYARACLKNILNCLF